MCLEMDTAVKDILAVSQIELKLGGDGVLHWLSKVGGEVIKA